MRHEILASGNCRVEIKTSCAKFFKRDMAWTKEVHHSRLQAKRETAAKKRYGEPVSYGRNSGLAPAALVACVLLKIVPAWLRNRHRFEKKGIRGLPLADALSEAPILRSFFDRDGRWRSQTQRDLRASAAEKRALTDQTRQKAGNQMAQAVQAAPPTPQPKPQQQSHRKRKNKRRR